ncbi:hypothetical protein HGG75_16570 [Ochrobactrum pseudogrignonense]|nr:hypothetical protein [Brucella pseudogrignonensis]
MIKSRIGKALSADELTGLLDDQNSQAFSCEILASLARSDGYLYRDNVGRSGGDVRLSSHEMACHDANGAEAAHVGEHVHSGLDGPLRARSTAVINIMGQTRLVGWLRH